MCLSGIYAAGVGVPLDMERALQIYTFAGGIENIAQVGVDFAFGRGITEDQQMELRTLEDPAADGSVLGIYNLTVLHEIGHCVQKTYWRQIGCFSLRLTLVV